MEVSHKCINKEAELCTLYDKKIILLTKQDTLRIVHFAHFQSLINYGITFGGSSTTICNVVFIQKIIIRIMMGLGPRSYGRGIFKKLDILTLLNLCSFASIMFVVRNQTTSRLTPLCIVQTGDKKNLHLQLWKFSVLKRVLPILL